MRLRGFSVHENRSDAKHVVQHVPVCDLGELVSPPFLIYWVTN